jgi:hypothetical protein
MAYARKVAQHKVIKVEEFREQMNGLSKFNLGTVQGRNDAHKAIANIVNGGQRFGGLFGQSKRFPDGWEDIYIDISHPNVTKTLVELQTTLVNRATNEAKDTQAGQKAGGSTQSVQISVQQDQFSQDNFKRVEQLIVQLMSYADSNTMLWERESFERRVGNWTVAAANP